MYCPLNSAHNENTMNVGDAKTRIAIRLLVSVIALALIPAGCPESVKAPYQVKLYGCVSDLSGTPIANCYINVSDENYVDLKNTYTNEKGYYELNIPRHELYHVWAGKTEHYMFMYIPQTQITTSGQVDFNLRAGANIIINAYDEQGNLLRNKDFRESTHSKVFTTDLNNMPAYGYFGAVHDAQSHWDWNLAIPAFIVSPQTPYKIHVQYEVPNFGKVMLSADNEGEGYSVSEQGGKMTLNLNYELAKSELKMLEKNGDSTVTKDIKASAKHLKAAERYMSRKSPDMQNVVNELNLSLQHSLWAHEQVQLARAVADIEKYRKGNIQIKVVDAEGNPLNGATIDFAQTSHDFLFGAYPLGENGSYDTKVADLMKEAGVNHSYITARRGIIEPYPGIFNWGNIDSYQKIEDQLEQGFNLIGALSLWFYPNSDFTPEYLKDMNFKELKEVVYNHMNTLAGRYKGKIDTWEINEMNLAGANALNLSDEQKLEICQVFAKAVREANPQARVLNGACALSYEFTDSIPFPELLKSNMPADIIGLEFYYSGTNIDGYPALGLDLSSISDLLDQYSTFGKPIYIKELSAPSVQTPNSSWWHQSWDEQTQAEYAKGFYTIAFSKPLVQAISWGWGISDKDAFIVNGGLLDSNLNPKPAYFALKRLIDSWTTTGTGVSDSNGNYNLSGFAGDYNITVSTPDGHSFKAMLHVTEQKTSKFTIQYTNQSEYAADRNYRWPLCWLVDINKEQIFP